MMKRVLILLMLNVWLSGSWAFAQEPHTEARETEHESESPLSTAFKWTNAILLFGTLVFVLRKPAGEFFANRKRKIASDLERAQQTEAEVNARMAEIEHRFASISAHIAALSAEVERQSVAERDKIVAETKNEVDRIMEESRQRLELFGRGIEREILDKVAASVAERAGNILQTRMTEDDHHAVVSRFISKL
jgi:F-type H+-transporting ATPase subunit b